MNLNDTVKMMNSANYKERFKAEYWQTKIRYEKLHRMTKLYCKRRICRENSAAVY